MSNYKEQSSSCVAYTRAPVTTFHNLMDFKGVEFTEERRIEMADGTVYVQPVGILRKAMTPENQDESFVVIDPTTGQNTSTMVSYAEVYAILTSLYLHLGKERDEADMEHSKDSPPAPVDLSMGEPIQV